MKPTTLLLSLPLTSASAILPRQSASPSIQAGALFTSSDQITSITGTFKVPHLSIPIAGPHANRKSGIYAFSIWIGIGGAPGYGVTTTCSGSAPGVLRAGIDLFYNGFDDRTMVPFAWYEGGPRSEIGPGTGAFGYAGFNVESGDLVRITVTAEGSSVDAVMENFGPVEATSGRTPVQRERPTYGLGNNVGMGQIEDHMTETEPSYPVVLSNFTQVDFKDLTVKTRSGNGNVAGAKIVNIVLPDQGGKLTDCAAVGTDGLTCRRTVE
ncbi:concanavalin A-like lectin/glucanase domain-containing protein [Immersiella caudata]|uniref:Concanavalin A-like lectin/glucanase domain-containing protein n=1 Tax=Immersiella caudata TaxID=314043 RepID=A0AA39X345_9PEZI|nr:concanavalin A-like lectin/glucanase domain-containing protein [Immersiella caudata]